MAGIPLRIIRSVQNPEKIPALAVQKRRQSPAPFRSQDFVCMGRGNCSDGIRIPDPCLQKIGPPVILKNIRLELLLPETHERNHSGFIHSLVTDIMNGQDRSGSGKGR